MINRMTTKQYNRLFLEALKELIEGGPERADENLTTFLARQTADSTAWPTDDALRTAFLDLPVYRLLTRARIRVVLEALEDDHRGPRSEDEFVSRGKLTVEHVMPQAWKSHWPLPDQVDPLLGEIDRDRLIHTFGNLTLATISLNTTMSNHAWEAKRDHLEDNSVLHLNRCILNQAREAGVWEEASIRQRGEALYKRAVKIWPRPN